MATREKISRRTWLKGMALAFAAAGLPLIWRLRLPKPKPAKRLCITKISQWDADVQHVQVLHFGGRPSLRHDGMPNGRRHDGTWNDGSRSVPTGRREN